MIQRFKLGEAQYWGGATPAAPDGAGDRSGTFPRCEGQQRRLLGLTRPDVIRDIHERYLAAGADLIETNTFGATTIAQEDYGMAHLAREMNLKSAQLPAPPTSSARPTTLLCGRCPGPTPKTASISPMWNDPARATSTLSNCARPTEQTEALVEGGADVLLVETIFDTLNAKAPCLPIDESLKRAASACPHHQRHGDRRIRPHPERADGARPSGTACATRPWPLA